MNLEIKDIIHRDEIMKGNFAELLELMGMEEECSNSDKFNFLHQVGGDIRTQLGLIDSESNPLLYRVSEKLAELISSSTTKGWCPFLLGVNSVFIRPPNARHQFQLSCECGIYAIFFNMFDVDAIVEWLENLSE